MQNKNIENEADNGIDKHKDIQRHGHIPRHSHIRRLPIRKFEKNSTEQHYRC